MKKKMIGIVVAVLVVAVGIGVWQMLDNLNALVAKAIEKYGSQATGTAVAVNGVDIGLREARGSISGLTVAEPDGFGGGDVFALGDVEVDLDLESVTKDPIVIEKILVRAPEVNAVFDAQGGSNLETLRKRLGVDGGGGSAGGAEKKIRIKSFVFEQGRIGVDASALGLEPRTVDLPRIALTDIGGAAGTDGAGVARAVVDAVVRTALQQVASSGVKGAVEDKLRGELDKAVGDEAKKLLKGLGK